MLLLSRPSTFLELLRRHETGVQIGEIASHRGRAALDISDTEIAILISAGGVDSCGYFLCYVVLLSCTDIEA